MHTSAHTQHTCAPILTCMHAYIHMDMVKLIHYCVLYTKIIHSQKFLVTLKNTIQAYVKH